MRLADANTLGILLLIVAGPVTSQEWRRQVEDLGDPTRSEAAECALVELGPKAVPALESIFDEWDVSSTREYERVVAALRVVDLLGEPASELQKQLAGVVTSNKRESIRGPEKQFMLPIVLQAVGSLTPYATDIEFHQLFHHSMVSSQSDEKAAVFRAIYRHKKRHDSAVSSIEEARGKLANDEIFGREVAAERMFLSGSMTDAKLLHDRLLDRDTRPKGWDALKHNGFVVPSDDDFALRGSLALVHIAPDDAVSAIGYALIARSHPHRSRRADALDALARFGPDAADTVPELLVIARGDDAELAADALKILGMCGRAAGEHMGTIAELADHENPGVSKRATSLVKMLGAMGFEAESDTAAEGAIAAKQRPLAVAVKILSDTDSDAVTEAEALIAQDADIAFGLLVDRLRVELGDCPDRVVEWIARTGKTREEDERRQLCEALANSGDRWSGPSFSSMSGGPNPSQSRLVAYGVLWIGAPAKLTEIAEFLDDDNAAVRLAAARELSLRPDDVTKLDVPTRGTPWQDHLWQAVTGDHPAKSPFKSGPHESTNRDIDLTAEIRTAAAAALIASEQPTDRHARLLRHAIRHESAAVATRAIATWGENCARADLEKAAKDERETVAEAAKNAIARRQARK